MSLQSAEEVFVMATRVLGPTGSRRRRRFLLVSLLLVSCAALFLAGSAQAVHAFQFQLDGDVSTHAYTTPGGQTYDWGANAGNVADSTGTAAQTDLAHSIFKVVNTANGSPRPVGTPPTNCDQTAGCQDVIPNPVTVP